MRLHEKMTCILEELRIYLDPVILTICTIPYNMQSNQHATEMNEKVRNINEIIRQIHCVLPVILLDVADMMERSFPDDASSDGLHFDRPKGSERLDGVLQRHRNALESAHFRSTHYTPFLCHWTPIQSIGSEGRLESQLMEQPVPTTGVHTDGGRRGRVIYAPKVRWYPRWW